MFRLQLQVISTLIQGAGIDLVLTNHTSPYFGSVFLGLQKRGDAEMKKGNVLV